MRILGFEDSQIRGFLNLGDTGIWKFLDLRMLGVGDSGILIFEDSGVCGSRDLGIWG